MADETTPTPKRTRNGTKKKTLATKLTEVMRGIDHVEKRGYNAHHNYKYVMEPELFAAVRLALADRHIMLVPSVTGVERTGGIVTIQMVYRLLDGDSGEVLEIPWFAEGQDTSDKAINKALTSASKYLIYKLFLIPTLDAGEFTDAENDTREVRPAKPVVKTATKPVRDNVFVKVSECQSTTGETRGKTWTRTAITFSDGRKVSTFDDKLSDIAQHAADLHLEVLAVTAPSKKNPQYTDLVALSLKDQDIEPPLTADDVPF